MATVGPDTLTTAPVPELADTHEVWPRGDRPDALRAAVDAFRARFTRGGVARALRTVDVATESYPVAWAFEGVARHLNPSVTLRRRLVVVQYEDLDGRPTTLAWGAPAFGAETALASVGLSVADVDLVVFENLQGYELRVLVGTDEREPVFPDAMFVAQRKEMDTLVSLHPAQVERYVPAALDGARADRLTLVDGDVELGTGVALLWTPGQTDGTQSLCLNTPHGVWVVSPNGVAVDNWQPHLSRIPGVREYAEATGRQVVMNAAGPEDPIDQYDSMLAEKALADAYRDDPRFANVLPCRELVRRRVSWPVAPTFAFGGIGYGTITAR